MDYFGAGACAAGAAATGATVVAALPPCPLNFVVQENSPSLCPTICSVTYTGVNSLPLWTAKVNPTNSGGMSQSRAHVLMIFFSCFSIDFITFLRSLASMWGPFLRERDIGVRDLETQRGSAKCHVPSSKCVFGTLHFAFCTFRLGANDSREI